MNQLRAAAGGAFSEIALLDEKRVVVAGGGIDGDAETSGTAADEDTCSRSKWLTGKMLWMVLPWLMPYSASARRPQPGTHG